jgi:hypothetical protein
MQKKAVEVLNHIIILLVYSFLLAKNISTECFSLSDNIIVLSNIVISIGLMFYLWSVKE